MRHGDDPYGSVARKRDAGRRGELRRVAGAGVHSPGPAPQGKWRQDQDCGSLAKSTPAGVAGTLRKACLWKESRADEADVVRGAIGRADGFGGKATRKEVTIRFTSRTNAPELDLLIYLPNERSGPVPVFLGLNFDGNHTVTAIRGSACHVGRGVTRGRRRRLVGKRKGEQCESLADRNDPGPGVWGGDGLLRRFGAGPPGSMEGGGAPTFSSPARAVTNILPTRGARLARGRGD